MGQNYFEQEAYDRMDKPGEECGVIGVYDFQGRNVASDIYYGLFALQHRGQESCGIAVSDTKSQQRKVDSHKDMGLVNEVFDLENLGQLKGDIGVGHVRYSTAGASTRENAQPLVINYVKGTLGVAHNGNLINAAELRRELEYTGAIFQTTIDSEVIAYHIARERLHSRTVEEAVVRAAKKIKGAYALVVMSPRKLIGARDPFDLSRFVSANGIRHIFLHRKPVLWRRSAQNISATYCRAKSLPSRRKAVFSPIGRSVSQRKRLDGVFLNIFISQGRTVRSTASACIIPESTQADFWRWILR